MNTIHTTDTTHASHTEAWCFEALDTWFFKESRPLEAVGGAQLSSMFPPPARTLIGAVRTALGDAHGVHWPDYAARADHPLRALMGSPESLGPLSFQGPYLLRKDGRHSERLYPAPLALMHTSPDEVAGQPMAFTRLHPGPKAVQCDLGWVRLPQKMNPELTGAKPAEEMWLTPSGLKAVLHGELPKAADLLQTSQLFKAEERLGIARDHHTKRPIDGLLYQTRHIRPHAGIALGMTVQGLDRAALPALARQGMARLGAEGRLAAWSQGPVQALPAVQVTGQRLMLCLLTHACFENGWVPDGFVAATNEAGGRPLTVWHGQLAGKNARLVSAVTGKPVREGGWDLASHKPRTLHALVPAGSCYFFELDSAQDARHVATALHGGQWGGETAWGRGQVAVGLWS